MLFRTVVMVAFVFFSYECGMQLMPWCLRNTCCAVCPYRHPHDKHRGRPSPLPGQSGMAPSQDLATREVSLGPRVSRGLAVQETVRKIEPKA